MFLVSGLVLRLPYLVCITELLGSTLPCLEDRAERWFSGLDFVFVSDIFLIMSHELKIF